MRAVVIFLVVAIAVPVSAQSPVTVFVSAPMRGGFVDTDKQIQDSINDIKTRAAKLKGVKLAPSRETADVVLTVVARGVGSEAYGQRINLYDTYGNVEITNKPIVANTFWTTAILSVGDYRKELVGAYTHQYSFSGGAWGDCASQIARALGAWIDSNREQLIAKRQ